MLDPRLRILLEEHRCTVKNAVELSLSEWTPFGLDANGVPAFGIRCEPDQEDFWTKTRTDRFKRTRDVETDAMTEDVLVAPHELVDVHDNHRIVRPDASSCCV